MHWGHDIVSQSKKEESMEAKFALSTVDRIEIVERMRNYACKNGKLTKVVAKSGGQVLYRILYFVNFVG